MSRVEHRLSDGFTAPGPYEDLEIKCYHSRRVPDPPDLRLREIYDAPAIEPSCQVFLAVETTPEPSTGKIQVYIPAESETGLAFSLTSKSLYKVRILIGGQNICSCARGEHDDESSIQDYFVTSGHLDIHGVFVKKDLVRQLVAVESEKAKYSIEHQITGKDEYLNIQIEFFPEKRRLTSNFYITVCTPTRTIKNRIHDMTRTPQDQQRLMYSRKQLKGRRTLGYYAIQRAHVVHLVVRVRGGRDDNIDIKPQAPRAPPTTIAPGGFIYQELKQDSIPGDWCEQPAQTVNLRVVNYERFTSITGLPHKAPSPNDLAKRRLTKRETKLVRPLVDEELHLRGIGEIHEETGIHINGPYDMARLREDDTEVKHPLTWRRILFCGC
ncbi:hypothetical protein B0J13DRAFT_600004 [Dactylonectria estremocensis]|uniref:Ubiquitin-like domain-containing protein n=1 Tax=Dactylonectria estremocensis TaxID=1079267 RepID=A0A9P9DC74_9HYPO|nr:hypothetical protein B0J13DRAFT_600004 [Dactylonectria estremocensis]